MIIQIASKLFDLSGYVALDPRPDATAARRSRRVNKVPTLDGGASVNDRGFSDSDRALEVSYSNQTEAVDAVLDRLVRFHSRVYVSTDEGLFECIPESFDPDQTRPSITLSVVQRMGA